MFNSKAREGITLLLNNDHEAAERLFQEDGDSLEMAEGKCLVTFISAILSYDPRKATEAVDGLRELEQRCSQDQGWIQSFKNRVFGMNYSDPDLPARLEEQIILADSQVCLALLSFFEEDISSYIKASWKLRRAWKVYQTTYTLILDLYKKTFPDDPVPGAEFPKWRLSQSASSGQLSRSDWSVHASSSQSESVPRSKSYVTLEPGPSIPGRLRSSLSYLSSFVSAPSVPESTIPPEVVARLMSAVSFGFGIFQLSVSFMPPSLLRVVQLFGFGADRETALNALMFARHGDNMRGPLALLALLWFHTIIRPFLALDGPNVQAGVSIASQLYEESKEEFAESALFLFFLGRIQRLKSNIPESLKAYETAIEKSPVHEVRIICLHEVGWCYLILLDWPSAFMCFEKLREQSRWSEVFYMYMSAVTNGARGDIKNAEKTIKEIPHSHLPHTNEERTTIESFLGRRARCLEGRVTQFSCSLLCIELLYLWNALPSTNPEDALKIIEQPGEEPIIGLSSLLKGVIYTYSGQLDKAEIFFRTTLEERKDYSWDPEDPDENTEHVAAFAAVELATLLMTAPHTREEGKNLMSEVREKYKGYDFENKIAIRITAALR